MVDSKAAPTSGAGVKTTTIETAVGADSGATIERDAAGNPIIHEQTEGTQHVDPGAPEGDEQQVDAGDTEADGDTGTGDETASELPDFKADDPTTVEAYDKAFTKDGGGLNLDAFSKQWWDSVKDGDLTKGTLTDGTYSYLESQYGLSKDEVKEIEAGQIAQRQAEAGSLAARAGGPEVYKAALMWGRKGGYSDDQIKSFNDAVNGKDKAKAGDAVDLLMARFDKATRSSARPKKSAAENASAGEGAKTADTFKSKDEWINARKAAGRDMVKQQAVSNKFRRSNSASWG